MQSSTAQQYYLNAIGLTQWRLKETDIKDKLLIPSGIYALDVADIPQKIEIEATIGSTLDPITESRLTDTNPVDFSDAGFSSSEQLSIDEAQNPLENIAVSPIIDNNSYQQPQHDPIESYPLTPVQPITKDSGSAQSKPNIQLPIAEVIEGRVKAPLFESIAAEISSCQKCTRRLYGEQSLKVQLLKKSSTSKLNKNILLVVESPSIEEYRQHFFFTGIYQSLIQSIFRAFNLEANIYISSLIKCLESDPYIVADKEIIDQELDNCQPFFKQELNRINADLIVTMGLIPLNYLVDSPADNKLSLENSLGHLFQLKPLFDYDKNAPVIATFHPSFLYRNPLFKKKALAHWIKIASIINK